MRVIDPGHRYVLHELDSAQPDNLGPHSLTAELRFVKREGEGYPGNVGHYCGTTTQEVLRALIDRTQYVDGQIHDDRNDEVLYHLRSAIFYLEARAADRHGRLEEFNAKIPIQLPVIETLPTCEKCNHIGCGGECRP